MSRPGLAGGVLSPRFASIARFNFCKLLQGLTCLLIVGSLAESAWAQATNGNGNWNRNGLATYNWAPPSTGPDRNWWGLTPGNFPSGVDATATITNNITLNQSLDLQSHAIQLRSLTIGDSNGTNNFSLIRSGTGSLTIGSTSGGGTISSANSTNTIAVPLTLGAASTFQHTTAGGGLLISGTVNNNGNLLTLAGSGNTSISGIISGTGGLTKSGTGTATLSGASTYSGKTTVATGTLILASGGSLANTSEVQVAAGATFNSSAAGTLNISSGQRLSGAGTLLGDVSIFSGGVLAPGSSPGTLTIDGDATFGGGGHYEFEINDVAGTPGSDPGWDLAQISGGLTISADSSNPFVVDVRSLTTGNVPGAAANFDDTANYSWALLTASGGISGFDPAAFALNTTQFSNSYTGTFALSQSGNSLFLNYFAAIPEPMAGLLLLGLTVWSLSQVRPRVAGRK